MSALAQSPTAKASTSQPTSDAPQDVPAVHLLTTTLFQQMVSGHLDRSVLTPHASAALTPAMLAEIHPSLVALGTLDHLQLVRKSSSKAGTAYVYRANFSSGPMGINVFVSPDGKVSGYRIMPDPTGTIQDDPKVHQLATTVFEQFLHNTIEPGLLTPQMNSALTASQRQQTSHAFASFGTLRNLTLEQKTTMQSGVNYTYRADFSNGPQTLQIFVETDGKVGGFHLQP